MGTRQGQMNSNEVIIMVARERCSWHITRSLHRQVESARTCGDHGHGGDPQSGEHPYQQRVAASDGHAELRHEAAHHDAEQALRYNCVRWHSGAAGDDAGHCNLKEETIKETEVEVSRNEGTEVKDHAPWETPIAASAAAG